MTITYVTGDATRPLGDGVRYIAHICNDKGKWGNGFVVALSRRSRTPEDCYRRWYREGVYEYAPFELGHIQVADFTEPDIRVANMIAQRGIRHDPRAPRAVDYDALRQCLEGLVKEQSYYARSGVSISVHMPRIGCGLGGGSWDQVEPIIRETLIARGVPVTVYDLKNS